MIKILLVEDDYFLSDIYLTRLKEAGYKVDMASNGEVALDKMRKSEPEFIILDILLPKVDGWEVLRQIKQDPKLKKIKVIILSNLGGEKDIEKGLKLGAIKYLVKTEYTPTEIVEEIKKILK